MNDLKHPLKLSGQLVDLISLEKKHFKELEQLASDKRIWEFFVSDLSCAENFNKKFNNALLERENGSQFPFVIIYKQDNKIIGSTRFLDIQPIHKKLEIGGTWLHPHYWATAVNLECKLLLLTYCFEILGTRRVQFKTDEKNLRSRKAIQKIGGQFEGILRNDMVRDNNTKRHSALYSIIDGEWKDNKLKLTELFLAKRKDNDKKHESNFVSNNALG